MIYLGNKSVGVNLNRHYDPDEWVKPDEWPDIESETLPGSSTENTLYVLYDRSFGCDGVCIYSGTAIGTKIWKGSIVNGQFVGELVSEDTNKYTDDLTEQYTVYKIVCKGDIAFRDFYLDTSYSGTYQSIVWIYGEMPVATGLGGATVNATFFPYCVHRINILPSPSFLTIPTFTFHYLKSCILGKTGNLNFNGTTVSRTGNGPVFPHAPHIKKCEWKNTALTSRTGGMFGGRGVQEVVLTNCSGTLGQQVCQSETSLRLFKVNGGTIKVTSMASWFSGCYLLREIDMQDVDFSESTSSGSCFGSCYSLQKLKLNNTWGMDLNLTNSALIDPESIAGIIDVLPTVESKTISLKAGVKDRLTASQIAVAEGKGWTIA